MTAPRWGTEVSFRLASGAAVAAREVARDLADAGPDAAEHLLFLDDASGGFGHLAVFGDEAAARGFADRPAVRRAVARVTELGAAKVHIRCYAMETITPTV